MGFASGCLLAHDDSMRNARRRSQNTDVERQLEQLDGLMTIGAKGEGAKIIRKILDRPKLTADTLWAVLVSIGMLDYPKRYRAQIEAAFDRLTAKEKRRAWIVMFNFYNMIREGDLARSFCNLRRLRSPGDLMFAMNLFLMDDDLSTAKKIERKCRAALQAMKSNSDASYLIDALSAYYTRIGEWDKAEALWEQSPRDEVPARQTAVGLVELFLARALKKARKELATAASLRKRINPVLTMSHPGLDDALHNGTERDLRRLEKAIEKILPPKRQKDFGLTARGE